MPTKTPDFDPARVLRDDAPVLQRFPSQLQKKALLRVDSPSFARRNPEEPGIELVYIRDEPARSRVHLTRPGRVWMEVRFDIPAVVGYLADAVPSRFEQRPEFLEVSSTREPACQPDQGDGKGPFHIHGHAIWSSLVIRSLLKGWTR